MRGSKALTGLVVLLAATLSQAQSSVDASTLASTDGSQRAGVYRAGVVADHGIKSRLTRIQAAITTPVIYPTAQPGVAATASHGGGLKGWVLLLMGAFLIVTISQRRYQALSDI